MECVICKKEAHMLVNDEPLCKIHTMIGIWDLKEFVVIEVFVHQKPEEE